MAGNGLDLRHPRADRAVFLRHAWIGRNLAGRSLNVALALFVLGGLGVLTWQSYARDAKDEKYQAALKQARAGRAGEGACRVAAEDSRQRRPDLLRTDAKTQGPRLVQPTLRQLPRLQRPRPGRHHPPRKADGRRPERLRQPGVAHGVHEGQGYHQPQVLRQHEVQAEENVWVPQGDVQGEYEARKSSRSSGPFPRGRIEVAKRRRHAR